MPNTTNTKLDPADFATEQTNPDTAAVWYEILKRRIATNWQAIIAHINSATDEQHEPEDLLKRAPASAPWLAFDGPLFAPRGYLGGEVF